MVRRSSVSDEPRVGARRCYLCKRELPLSSFRVITTRQRRGAKVYSYTGPSNDCRDCNREYKREQRRREAEAAGKAYEARGDRAAWEARRRSAREQRDAWRRAARAVCNAFRALVRPSPEELRRQAIERVVARQRERRRSDADYQAQVKAKRIRRDRAQRGTQVVPVNRERVAERDGWRCAICGGGVTRANWSLDHVMPLSKGGPHTYENVVLAHRSCNSRRGAGRFPVHGPQRSDVNAPAMP